MTPSLECEAVLFRVARRRSSWTEARPAEEVAEYELRAPNGGLDLRPSVYDLDDTEDHHVRAWAEHVSRIEPERRGLLIVATPPPGPVVHTPGTGPFAFTRARHRELQLSTESAAISWVRTLQAKSSSHQRKVSLEQARSYAATQLREGDPEWGAAATHPGAKKWVRKLEP
jgi:hypothetical protein